MTNKDRIGLSKDECEAVVGQFWDFNTEQIIKALDLSEENKNENSIKELLKSAQNKFGALSFGDMVAAITIYNSEIWKKDSFKEIVKELMKL